MALGLSKNRERRRSALCKRASPHERHEELDAHRDAMALFDHGRELREQRAVRLSAGHARKLRAKRQMGLAARGDARELRPKLDVVAKASRAEGGGAPRFFVRKCL